MEPLVSDFFKARGLTKFQIDSLNNFVNDDLKRIVDVNGFIIIKLSADDENEFSLQYTAPIFVDIEYSDGRRDKISTRKEVI
ncbi:DNA-directed RNA polymerase [Trifolium repens]|nr:DNA-directed RNA polymerase [Trifolium repens]